MKKRTLHIQGDNFKISKNKNKECQKKTTKLLIVTKATISWQNINIYLLTYNIQADINAMSRIITQHRQKGK